MKTSVRFERAITKLYKAYHEGTLHPEYEQCCAVGTICDHTDTWTYLSNSHGSLKLSYIGALNENLGRKIHGYSPLELLQIEAVFLRSCGFSLPLRGGGKRPKDPTDKELLFEALCETVGFLCKLDAIPNVLDYTKLFKPNNKLKHTVLDQSI